MGISECAIWPGNARRCSGLIPPVARAANEKVSATTEMKMTNPTVRSADNDTVTGTSPTAFASRSAELRHVTDDEKLSNAVEPSSTAKIATTPGRIGNDNRWSNGLPIAILPVSGLRRNGDSREIAML